MRSLLRQFLLNKSVAMPALRSLVRRNMAHLFIGLFLLGAQTAFAEEDCGDACVETGQWQLGLALGYTYAPNPLAEGDDISLPLIPRLSYYGERFFIETGSFGYTLAETANQRLNVVARPNLDYFYFAGNGDFTRTLSHPFAYSLPGELSERKLTYLGGFEYSWFAGPWQVQLTAGHDISVGHEGNDASVSGKYRWQHDDSSVELMLGLLYRDRKLTDYYYGVTDAETIWLPARYHAGASLSPYLSFTAQHYLSEKTSLLLMLAVQKPDAEITASPLVSEHWFVASFVGLAYDF